MQWCARKECCRRDVYRKILEWQALDWEAREMVDWLTDQNFVNDRRYAEAYTNDKLRFNKHGRVKIAHQLRTKHIDKAVVADVLSKIDENQYLQTLVDELQKKHRTLQGDAFEIKGKLFRFAMSRGFEQEIIAEAIALATNDSDTDNNV